ncbi:uncharacterized protein LOC134700982 [Mytilus trossulus]|uniref:uncharacterized protein LOC134700982 n=1 Tax=Mytilus trossulus TaxID=6551 RepID=UPI003004BDFB
MVVMDWAMKFLPLLFREKQSDWFGQKGLNWHVTVCVFKDYENQLKHRTYVHVMDGVKQDWYSVACMLQHVLLALKKQQPTVTTAFLRSDNAGCYHCSNLWHAVPAISEETGVNIQRYDFSESQDGKSYCDAKIAHMRAKLRKYVSNGGNISCSADMKKALDDGEGVPGCQIAHVDIPLPVDQLTLQRKIKGITKISNVQFENWCQLKYWKNYNIGEGQTMSITPINLESTLNVLSDFKVPCKDTGNILAAREKQPSEESQSDVNLTCPEHNCNAVLHSYSELNDHCFVGDHHYMSTFDGIKMKWRDICLDIDTTSSKTKHSTLSAGTSELSLGWALKKDRKNHRFSEKVKVYLKGVFDEGESSGNKANPVNVSRNMRVCHDGDGMKMFTPKEYLQPSQITSYFSRLVVLSRAPATDVVEDDIDSTIAIINQAEALEELVNIFV